MKRIDANGDGKIQKDELPKQMQPLFDRLDGNSDGTIDSAELKALSGSRGGGQTSQRKKRSSEQSDHNVDHGTGGESKHTGP